MAIADIVSPFSRNRELSLKTRRQALYSLLLLATALAAAGCGKQGPFTMAPISGKVTYADGSLIPAHRIIVTFVSQTPPIDAKTHPRPGTASVNLADGTFSAVTTWKANDGVVLGPHKVLIVALDKKEEPTDAVPGSYRELRTTPLSINVEKSGPIGDLLVEKKPAAK